MTHPITPPPELVEEWIEIAKPEPWKRPPDPNVLCAFAARWGADQELEACVKLLELSDKNARDFLYSARRPKPLSSKQQALQALGRFTSNAHTNADEMMRDFDLILQALQEIKDED